MKSQVSFFVEPLSKRCSHRRNQSDLMDRVAAHPTMGAHKHKISSVEDAWQSNLSSSLVRQLLSEVSLQSLF